VSLDWFGEPSLRIAASNPSWSKWSPCDPTCPHWYAPENLERLICAHVGHDADTGQERTVREFIAQFRGLTGTAKQKAVLQATGLSGCQLSALVSGEGLDQVKTEQLLTAMKDNAKPCKPSSLGVIGRDHLSRQLERLGCQAESFEYRKSESPKDDSLPWVLEAAFAWGPAFKGRRLITGVNWSPGILNPFRQLGRMGSSLDRELQELRVGPYEPVVLLLHIACPRVQYTDRGKSAVVVEH
jgi:hypothetical protein